jgi:hypothetical protein
MDRVIVALPVKVPYEFQKDVTIYRKIEEAKATDTDSGYIMRGVTYEAVN